MHWQDILYLFAMGFVFQFRTWLVNQTLKLVNKPLQRLELVLVRNEREALEWVHYHDRAAKQGHQPKRVLDCQDGDCAKVTK